MENQIYPYLKKFFSKYQCGFRKGFSAQHSLIAMIEKWRQSLDSGGQTTTFLTDLLKTFDCIYHELLIAKLNAYGFDNSSLTFIYSYYSERKQKYYLVYPKVQSWEHLHLTFIYVTSDLALGI